MSHLRPILPCLGRICAPGHRLAHGRVLYILSPSLLAPSRPLTPRPALSKSFHLSGFLSSPTPPSQPAAALQPPLRTPTEPNAQLQPPTIPDNQSDHEQDYLPPQWDEPPRGPSPLSALLTVGAVILLTVGITSAVFLYTDVFRDKTRALYGLVPGKVVPFVITDREDASPTSVILTLRPRDLVQHYPAFYLRPDGLPLLDLWSVEAVQNQMQISRMYTPLPPRSTDEALSGTVRLLFRVVPGGEMSPFLAALPVGTMVPLRGPTAGLHLRDRLAECGRRVVVLAGGTAISTAMQAAHSLLADRPFVDRCLQQRKRTLWRWPWQWGSQWSESRVTTKPWEKPDKVTILWAVRSVDDLFWPATPPADPASPSATSPPVRTPVAEELASMADRYNGRLEVVCLVDNGDSTGPSDALLLKHMGFDPAAAALAAAAATVPNPAVSPPPPSPPVGSGTPDPAVTDAADRAASSCLLHSRTLARLLPETDAKTVKTSLDAMSLPIPVEQSNIHCHCPPGHRGKNLLLVAGPDGFVVAMAGPMTGLGSERKQGPVRGLLGDLLDRFPTLQTDWMILKV